MAQDIKTEILIVGGGTSGVCAALQAVRMGRKVVLVEETPWLGGMMTAAGVAAIDGNHMLPSGLWGEFRDFLYLHYGGAQSLATGWVSHTMFEPSVGNKILKKLVRQEKNILTYHGYWVDRLIKEENRITGAEFVNDDKERMKISAGITIEATECGDVIALAGCDYTVGRESSAETGEKEAPERADDIIQDLTYVAILKDYGTGMKMTIEPPAEYDPELFRDCCSAEEVKPTEKIINSQKMLEYGRLPKRKYMLNWPGHGNDYHVNVLNMSHDERIEALKAAKKHTLGMVYYIQTELGYSFLGLADDEYDTDDKLPYIPYHRESRRIIGDVRLTINHIKDIYANEAGAIYKTGIAVGDYPLDHHHEKATEPIEENFPPISAFNVPYGCLIPKDVDGLLVAEKSISVTHIVNGCTRLQPVVMQIGQAAGASAALCLEKGIQPRDLNVRLLQQYLLLKKCWIMPFCDVKSEDWHFVAVQRIAASGVMKGEAINQDWRNEMYFHPDEYMKYDEACQVIEKILNNGVIVHPDRYENTSEFLNRVEMLHLVWKALGKPEADPFPYHKKNKRFEGEYLHAIQYFYDYGWKLPRGFCKDLEPDRKVTRAEFAFIIDSVFDPFNNL